LAPKGNELFVYPTDAGAGIRLSTLLIASVELLRPSAH
jgi:hypothetical protein